MFVPLPLQDTPDFTLQFLSQQLVLVCKEKTMLAEMHALVELSHAHACHDRSSINRLMLVAEIH